MKALTVWQPWATLIALGHKPFEFRGWKAPSSIVGQRIAVHAGARKPRWREIAYLAARIRREESWRTGLKPDAEEYLLHWTQHPEELWLSCIVATVVLGTPTLNTETVANTLGGRVNDSDREAHANWAWPLTEIEPMEPPIPARGRQGFWKFDERLIA